MKLRFPSRRLPAAEGFTLLELSIVLFIMVLFLGAAAMSFSGFGEEEALRKPAGELQQMAREAVQRAGMYERAEMIVFDKNGFGILYKDEPSATKAPRHWIHHVQLPDGVVLHILRWGEKDWKNAGGQRWIMQPSGLCEPLVVRLDKGKSFLEMQFNPITGGVADQRMTIASQ